MHPRAKTLDQELRGLDPKSKAYQDIVAQYKQVKQVQEKASAYRHRLVMGIMDLCKPLKHINVSKLSHLNNQQLISIGKAARALHNALHEAQVNK